MQDPEEDNLEAACKVLRYLKGNPGQGSFLQSDSALQVCTFCDSDWGAYHLTWCSLTSFLISLGGSPIAWKRKKQNTVSRSSAEAEYHAMAIVTSEMIWIKTLLTALVVFLEKAIQLFCCLLYTSPSPRDGLLSRMPSSA